MRTKTAQELRREFNKEPSTRPQNSPDPNQMDEPDVPIHGGHWVVQFSRGALCLCTTQCLEAFYGSKNVRMNARIQVDLLVVLMLWLNGPSSKFSFK